MRVAFNVLHMLIITMPDRKGRFIAYLFSAYFLLYVLSPVCFTGEGPSGIDTTVQQTNHNTRSIRVVWELILSKYFSNKDAESTGSNVQLLIRKARAVTSNSFVKLTPLESSEVDYNGISFYLNSYSSLDWHIAPESRSGYYLSASGLSPPSFS